MQYMIQIFFFLRKHAQNLNNQLLGQHTRQVQIQRERRKGSSLQSKYRKLKIQFVSHIIHSFDEYMFLYIYSLNIWMNESAAN